LNSSLIDFRSSKPFELISQNPENIIGHYWLTDHFWPARTGLGCQPMSEAGEGKTSWPRRWWLRPNPVTVGEVAAKALGWLTWPIWGKKRDWELTGEALHTGAAQTEADGGARPDERSPAPAWRSAHGGGFAASSLPDAATANVVTAAEGNGSARGDLMRKGLWRHWSVAHLGDGRTVWGRRPRACGW
jgi:hypothetical protein